MTTLHAEPTPLRAAPPHLCDLRSHRRLRGPYTAGGELLRHIVPELLSVSPGLVKPASTAVVAIAPDLEGAVPVRPQTLTDLAEGNERTRFYAVQRTRDLAYMVSELVLAWARACHPEGVTLRFWELAAADATDAQLFAVLARRCVPPGVIAPAAAPPAPAAAAGSAPGDLVQRYIDADGTSTDPAQLRAYESAPARERRARHSRRAALLADQAEP